MFEYENNLLIFFILEVLKIKFILDIYKLVMLKFIVG